MNDATETYSYKNVNIDTSQSSNYHPPLNHNYTYYTLHTTLSTNTKNKYLSKSKNNHNNNYNPTKSSRNNLGKNFIYNQTKVISLHKNMDNKKMNKKWKTFGNINEKSINLLHRNNLKDKLLQSKLYKLIEKTANDNYLKEKKKRNTFITTIEEDNLDEKENIKNIMTDNEVNKKIKKRFSVMQDITKKTNKILLDLNPSFTYDNTEKEKFKINLTNNYSNNFLSLTQIKSGRNKFLNLYKLQNITLPCIKFNNSLNTLDMNPNHKNSLAQTCIAKLKIDAIKKALDEHYKTFFEKREFPISFTDTMYRFYVRNEKYFFIFDDLMKKYLQFLTGEIKDNFVELKKLLHQKEILNKENDEKLKQICSLDDQIKIYESFNSIYLNLKNKAKQVTALSPKKSPQRMKKRISRLSTDNYNTKRVSIFRRASEFIKKRESNTKKNYNTRNSAYPKLTSIYSSPRKARELFKNTQEIQEIFEERDKNVFQAYQKYVEQIYALNQLSLDREKEKQKEDNTPEIVINNNIISKLESELIHLKVRNKALNDYKNAMIEKESIKKEEEEEKKAKNKESKILRKLKAIILNPRLNLEKILGMKNIYIILKEKEFTDSIIYKGQSYTKEVFYLKILEYLYLKIEQRNNNFMNDKNLREKYIKIKTEREKELKFLKCEQNLLEEKMNIMRKNYELMNKSNKIIVLRNRKFDPFYKKYIKDKVIKKRMKSKEEFDKLKLENENDKYNYYLYY